MTLAGVVQVKPAEGVAVNEMVPAKLLSPVTVIVELAVEPALIVAGDAGPADIVKSTTLTVTVEVRVSGPLVAVTVAVYVPTVVVEGTVMVRVEPAELIVEVNVTLAGLGVAVGPLGVTEAVRATVPVNPLPPLTVMVDVCAEPGSTVRVGGLAARVRGSSRGRPKTRNLGSALAFAPPPFSRYPEANQIFPIPL